MPIQVEDITIYNVKEISDILGITQVTIREYIRQRKLWAKKIAGGWRITGESLRDFLSDDKTEKKHDSNCNHNLMDCYTFDYIEFRKGINYGEYSAYWILGLMASHRNIRFANSKCSSIISQGWNLRNV